MNVMKRIGLAALLVASAAGSVFAQDQQASQDQPAQPAAEAQDAQALIDRPFELADGQSYASWDIQFEVGRTYHVRTVDLSDGCDTVVELRQSTDAETAHNADPIVISNDDRADGDLSSEMTFTVNEAFTGYFAVRAYGPETGGTGHLVVEEIPQP